MPDYTVEDTVYKRFTTRAFATGIPTALSGTPVVSAYEDNSAVQITAGITLGVDHDSVAGLNLLTIVATAANGFEAGKSYDLVITTGTVGGVSVVGEVVWHFTLSAEAAAVDLANGTDGLGAIKAETAAILTDTAEIGAAGAGLTEAGGTGDHLTAIDLPNQTMDIVGNITGNLSGSVGSVTGAVGSVTGNVGGTINGLTATALADMFDTDSGTTYGAAAAGSVVKEIADNAGGSALTEAGIADAVWDEALAGHVGAGSAGKAVADIETDAAAILVDTGTTLDGKINTIDTNVDAILVDTGTTIPGTIATLQADTDDIQTRLPAALSTGRIIADVQAINDDATAADNLGASALGVVPTTVNDAGASITAFIAALTEATDDHYNGRIIVFTSGDLAGQATDITDYDGTTKTVTVTALTEAPANGVSFVIV